MATKAQAAKGKTKTPQKTKTYYVGLDFYEGNLVLADTQVSDKRAHVKDYTHIVEVVVPIQAKGSTSLTQRVVFSK